MNGSAKATSAAIDFSLVVPAYNEASGIEELVKESVSVLAGLGGNFEVVIVDDGSRDGTGKILKRLSAEFPSVKPISLRVNSGQHIATFIGLRESRGEIVFLVDADLKSALPELRQLLAAARADETRDIVTGIRPSRSRSLHRSIGSSVVSNIVNRLTGSKLQDPASPLRLYRRHVIEAIIEADVLAQNLPILTALLGLRVQEIPLNIPDSGRNSRYEFSKLVHVLVLALLNFSAGTRTILTLIMLGAASIIVGFAGMAVLTVRGVLAQEPLSTNLLLLFVLLTVVGLQFSLMGAIAYKLERINTNLRFRQLVYGARYDRPK